MFSGDSKENPNVNGLNTPIKRHKVAEWLKKQDPTICSLQETKHRLRTYIS